jgi:RNA polymerase sigma-70 factor (ECF subfamily)
MMMEQNELNTVIEQCRHRNQDSFATIVREYQNMAFSLCLKMLCNEDDAKDAVQNTFVAIWKNLRTFDAGKSQFSTWVYTIASRICLDSLRHRKDLIPLSDEEAAFSRYVSHDSGERQLMNREWISIVKVLAAGLSPKQRLVFTLGVLENRDAAEIEAITGMDADKIKSNLYIARQRIKEQLKRLGYGQE